MHAILEPVLCHACTGALQGGLSVDPSRYPPVYRDNVTDNFFRTEVADPYRWLEDTDSNATLACEALPSLVKPHTPMLNRMMSPTCLLKLAGGVGMGSKPWRVRLRQPLQFPFGHAPVKQAQAG